MKQLLCHERLYVRFLALFGLGVVLFTLAWTLSYHFLPEGVLRGRTGSAILAGDEAAGSFIGEWLRIVVMNLMAGSLIVLSNRIYRYKGYPLGYIIPLAHNVRRLPWHQLLLHPHARADGAIPGCVGTHGVVRNGRIHACGSGYSLNQLVQSHAAYPTNL